MTLRITQQDLKRMSQECPICQTFLDRVEREACKRIRALKPGLPEDACRRVLRSRLDGKSTREIAMELGIPEDKLVEAVMEAIKSVEKK